MYKPDRFVGTLPVLLVLVLGLVGCAVGPDYKKGDARNTGRMERVPAKWLERCNPAGRHSQGQLVGNL